MGRFLSGFIVASVLWGAGLFLYLEGHLEGLLGPSEAELAAAEAQAEQDRAEQDQADDRRKRRRRRRRHKKRRRRAPRGQAQTGDDIGWDEDRKLDMAAGEAQLTGSQIEAGFDSVFRQIRRCLVLVPPDAPVRGKLVFGMRVAGNGRPTAVNLSGPAAITTGEAGSCLRKAARSIRFASYDGPETVFRYPIELE